MGRVWVRVRVSVRFRPLLPRSAALPGAARPGLRRWLVLPPMRWLVLPRDAAASHPPSDAVARYPP